MRKVENTEPHKSVSILVALMGILILTIYPTFALLLSDKITIRNSGVITPPILPLHIEGRHIKNSLNQTILLKGVNKPEFVDDPDGIWMGNTKWRDENVIAELDAMKSWGINVIRCHISVELWRYDIGPASGHPASIYCSLSAREAINQLLALAAERGIYVILDAYSVKCYWSGGEQDPLPFPPYATSPNASEIIGSVDDFVDFWRSVASELKDHPNVMFSLWNEPNPPMEAWSIWIGAANQCINAIREEGFTGIILFEWRTGVYCNVYSDGNFPLGVPQGGYTLYDWLYEAIEYLEDPLGNLAFDVHFYRIGGSAGQLWTDSSLEEYWNSSWAYNYTQIKMCMEYMGWKWAAEKAPLICGEVGGTLGWINSDPTQHQYEMEAFENVLSIFEEWDIGYIAYWWREIGVYRLHNGPPSFNPTDTGQIVKAYLLTS